MIFRTKEIAEFWPSQKIYFEAYWQFLDAGLFEKAADRMSELQQVVKGKRADLTDADPDELVNDFVLLAATLHLLHGYASFWSVLHRSKFSDSWSALQNLQDSLRTVLRFSQSSDVHLLRLIEQQCGNLEHIYPYNIFCSVEMAHDPGECTICGKAIDDPACPHLVGELYRGQIASELVRNLTELQAVSFVENPLDKRCVVNYPDDGPHFKVPRYLVSMLIEHRVSVFRLTGVERQKRLVNVSDLKSTGRNDKCPCGSSKKFKKCCLPKGQVERDHLEIVFSQNRLLEVDDLVYLRPARPDILVLRPKRPTDAT